MKRFKHKFKKGLAFFLSLAMVTGLIPAMPGGANVVLAENNTDNTPSVYAYATKEQLMNETFAPNTSGNATNIGKLVFGKNSSGSSQEWYILGKDSGVTNGENNTIIFAASPIATGQKFVDSEQTYNYEAGTGYGDAKGSISVNENHYGASAFRKALQDMVKDDNTKYFTEKEKALMNVTTVGTIDTKNKDSSYNYVTYTTTDKMYALAESDSTIIKAGSSKNQIVLAMNSYWQNGEQFWLRSPHNSGASNALHAVPSIGVGIDIVGRGYAVRPASNLNLSSVIFASAASVASSSETVKSGTIASGTAMTLRLDGSDKNIGLVTYNTTTGNIKATKGSTTGTVALVVQGKDGTNDWYYSKQITETDTVTVPASDIKTALNLTTDIDLSSCKIWLETTGTDGMIYAVNAEKEIEKINTTYVTKEQLMNSFTPYSNGTAANIGKLVFGHKPDGSEGTTPQEWYILGKDSGVKNSEGQDTDNTIIFAASPIAYGQKFLAYSENAFFDRSYDSDWNCSYQNPISKVDPNHYGGSDLRKVLQNMVKDDNTNYFTGAEKKLMNSTIVEMEDRRNNNVTYTTADELYALAANGEGDTTIKAGSSNQIALAKDSYWSEGNGFWLRSPNPFYDYVDLALLAAPGDKVGRYFAGHEYAVRPASNLNLSSVIFASAASAASETASSGTIASDTAMTLRLDGSDKNIGTVTYNTTTGDIKASKGSIGDNVTVALVVQGNDGTNDWYYSKQITGTETVKVSAIEAATNTPASVNLSACKIWLETTDSTERMIYAVNATETAISSISSVEITEIDTPIANTALDTEAVCATTGVSTTTPLITWTPDDSTAQYDTSYTASVTLTADTFYEFADTVTATVLGNAATSVEKNQDGTLTVTYEFPATEKEKHTITATAGTNGSISPSGAVEVEKGKSQTFAITPAQGYKISGMEVDGVSVSVNSSYTFDNVTQNHTIEVTFTKKSSGIPITPSPIPTPTPKPEPIPEPEPTPEPDPIPDNGWYTDEEGNKYFYEEGNLVKNQWYQYEGKWYYLNTDGWMQTGWLKDGDKWYYLNPDGEMQTGWLKDGDKWYYLNPNGDMKTGWLKDGDKWYYLNPNGDMKTGWLKDGDKWYYLNPNGDMKTGWLKDGDKWYYLNPDGEMKTGWLKDKDKWYYLNPNGDMKIGWLLYKNDWYYLNPDGDMKAGWLYYKNDWYYLNSDGAMVTDTKVDGYTINHDGIWVQ